MKSFDYITNQATSTKGLGAKETVLFHHFNPNGLYAEQKALDEEIRELVNKGLAMSGALVAHGSLDDFHANLLRRTSYKKMVTKVEVRALEYGYSKRNEAAREFIASCKKTAGIL